MRGKLRIKGKPRKSLIHRALQTAGGGTRTLTWSPRRDFESRASADSATPAPYLTMTYVNPRFSVRFLCAFSLDRIAGQSKYICMGRRRKAWLWGGDGKRFQDGRRVPGWYARYYDYHGGHRINRSKQFRTQPVAREWVKRHNAQKDLREIGEVVPVPMGEAVREFIRGCSTLAEDTITHYLSGLAMFEAVLGNKPVSEVDGADIDCFVARRLTASAEPTVAKHIRTIRRFFNWAMDRGYAAANPVALATTLPADVAVRERPPVTDKQLAELIRHLDTEDRRIAVWLAMTTGLDRGVIERLCTAQVDQEACCIRLQRPKTRRRKRTEIAAPIHPAIAPLLFERLCHIDPSKPLLSGLARQADYKDWWKIVVEKAGLPGLLFRDLRAVAASRPQRLAGLSLTDVQKLLGHSSPTTTAGHYHLPDPSVVQRLSAIPLPGLRSHEAQKKGKRGASSRRGS